MKERYKLTIEPLTPVHIGTGKILTPLEYMVVKNQQKEFCYTRFSSDSILKRIAMDKTLMQKFETISKPGNMSEIQTFFHESFSQEDLIYLSRITTEFERNYGINKNKDPLQNASEVFEMYRPEGSKIPVIPGSSLKGAIRTAILNFILNKEIKGGNYKIIELKNAFESKLQKALLGNFNDAKNDPFRCIQISDCSSLLSSSKNQIVGLLKNVSYNEFNEKLEAIEKLQIQAECISGILTDSKTVLEGVISIDDDLFSAKQISKKITMKDIIKSCNDFFFNEFCEEGRKFYRSETDDTELIDSLYNKLNEITDSNDSFIVRVGRWSQVEFVTFGSDFRKPKTPRGKDGKPKGWGGTRTLFDYNGQYLPMGWCKCTIEKIN